MSNWSREETLAKTIDLILEPTLTPQERELFIRFKEALYGNENVTVTIEKVQAKFQTLENRNQISNYGKEFSSKLPINLDENRYVQAKVGISEGRIVCLIGVIIFTLVIFNSIFRASFMISFVSNNQFQGSATIVVLGIMILINIIQIVFVWYAFSKYSSPSGRKWSIFLLIYGILLVFWGAVILIDNGVEGLGYVIAGISMIISYVLKN